MQSQSLRRLLLGHESVFLILVIVAGALGGVWAYFWQQTAAESIRLNALAHVAQEIRSDLFRQVKEASLARMRDDPAAETVYSAYTKAIKARFNSLRQQSESRAEAYAVQAMQQAYSSIQADMNTIFDDSYLLNRIVRSNVLDPSYEQALLAEFESAFRNFRGLINQQLAAQEKKISDWSRFAPFVIPIPIIIAAILLLFSRASLQRGFVRPVQKLVAALRKKEVSELSNLGDPGGVSEVGEITAGLVAMAAELERTRDAAIDNERQAALGALVPVVAHNIRNPLASIRASAQLLDHDGADPEVRESQAAITETVDRLERWVSALVSYLHPLQPHYRTIRIDDLFNATLGLLEPRLNAKSITIKRDDWHGDALVEADPDLMEQALYALLNNALEASPVGAPISLSSRIDSEVLRITIEDAGGGISFIPEPTGLEPGPTTKKRGTGLGIPIAFKVCKAHGWELKFEVRENIGTIVAIVAPLIDKAEKST